MGTRGICGFKYQDKYYLMYNQYDAYPEGLGRDVVEFVNGVVYLAEFDKLKENVSKLKLVNNKIIPTQDQIKKYQKYSDINISRQTNQDWYCLFRKLQDGKILYEVLNGNVTDFYETNEFAKDSLFCEYGYVVNLDTMQVDFYNGYQKEPQKGNQFGEEEGKKPDGTPSGFFPIKLVGSMDFANLLTENWENKFF